MDLRYLVELIIMILLSILGATFIPYICFCVIYKDIKVEENLAKGRISYLQSTRETGKANIIFKKIGVIFLPIIMIIISAVLGITEGKNIYYIATGNYVCIEGMVDRKESRRDCRLITINGIEVKESNLVPSQIEKFHRYKITYLKESNYCIKVEAIK